MHRPRLIQRYQLVEPLGEGGFAKTYLAKDAHRENTYCVVKHLVLSNPSSQSLETARRLFRAEAEVLKKLGKHDRIPALIDAFEEKGEFYLVQEFIDGDPLSRVFKQQTALDEAQARGLLEEILPVLTFIHQQQVIHRDIKPSNVMQRRSDGKPMLIDFGAVKEITTEFYTADSEQLTVSIGTQGYSAPEQMAGRPRYSSDLYSLGMTIIQGLTGRSPTELFEDPQTGELLWQVEAPHLSPGFVAFLRRLTHASVYQRYPSADIALSDLKRLDTLANPLTLDIPETSLLESKTQSRGRSNHRRFIGAIASLITAVAILTIRQLGGLESLELFIYDEWAQRRGDLGRDHRLLLVEIGEADLKALKRSTPSDITLSQAIQTLQNYQPRVIGLDLYRDLPQGNGHAELLETLKADNIIAIEKIGNRPSEAIPPPSTVSPERVGFNDFPIDADGVVRRNLLFASANNHPDSEVLTSFGLRLAIAYIEAENITPLASDINADYMELNGTTFVPLDRTFGGYRTVDSAGYQVMLQYRSAKNAVQRLSLTHLLKGQFTEEMIRDRIVIIGTTAPSSKDMFFTPYSSSLNGDFLMPGVLLHVHATSQILSSALDGEKPLEAFPEAAELGWIVLWAVGGSILGTSRRPSILWVGLIAGEIALVIVSFASFGLGRWLPLTSASIAFLCTTLVTAISQSYAPQDTNHSTNNQTAIAPTEPSTE